MVDTAAESDPDGTCLAGRFAASSRSAVPSGRENGNMQGSRPKGHQGCLEKRGPGLPGRHLKSEPEGGAGAGKGREERKNQIYAVPSLPWVQRWRGTCSLDASNGTEDFPHGWRMRGRHLPGKSHLAGIRKVGQEWIRLHHSHLLVSPDTAASFFDFHCSTEFKQVGLGLV